MDKHGEHKQADADTEAGSSSDGLKSDVEKCAMHEVASVSLWSLSHCIKVSVVDAGTPATQIANLRQQDNEHP